MGDGDGRYLRGWLSTAGSPPRFEHVSVLGREEAGSQGAEPR